MMHQFIVVIILFLAYSRASAVKTSSQKVQKEKFAIVTLLTGGSSTGYLAGALALGQSLKDLEKRSKVKYTRVVMVTSDLDQNSRKNLQKLWKVVEVKTYYCNYKPRLDPKEYDLQGERYLAGIEKWSTTCTKFAAWSLIEYDRIIFMDADTIAVEPLGQAFTFSNASFLASPEVFPPDNFNSGVLVIKPSLETLKRLEEVNKLIGSAEGGDQGVFNNGLCPNWFLADSTDIHCGRLPWRFNVEANYYNTYKTLQKMSIGEPPAVIHFVSDGKPWKILALEYMPVETVQITDKTFADIANQGVAQLLWRDFFFRASGDKPVNSLLLALIEANGDIVRAKQIRKKPSSSQSELSKSSGIYDMTGNRIEKSIDNNVITSRSTRKDEETMSVKRTGNIYSETFNQNYLSSSKSKQVCVKRKVKRNSPYIRV